MIFARLFIFAACLATASMARAEPLFTASYPDNGVTVMKRILDTYQTALNSKKPNGLQNAITTLRQNLSGIGAVRSPNKDHLFLLAQGTTNLGEHNKNIVVRTGRYLLAVPITLDGIHYSEDRGEYILVYYSIVPKKRVDIVLDSRVEISERTGN